MQKFKTKVLSFLLTLCMLTGMIQPMGALVVQAAETKLDTANMQIEVTGIYQTDLNNEGNAQDVSMETVKSYMFDNDPKTFWNSNHVEAIDSENANMVIDLGAEYKLTKVDYTPRVYNDSYNCTGNISKLVVEVSTNKTDWTQVNEGGTTVALGSTGSFPVSVDFEGQTVKYVRISGTESYHWNTTENKQNTSITIGDLAFYGEEDTTTPDPDPTPGEGEQGGEGEAATPIESSKITVDSVNGTFELSGVNGENPAVTNDQIKAAIFDNNNQTYWTSAWVAGDNLATGAYYVMKLDGVYSVDRLDYIPRWHEASEKWACTGNIKNIIVEVKVNESDEWTVLTGETGVDFSSLIIKENADQNAFPVELTLDEAVDAQYIRIRANDSWNHSGMNGQKGITISELDVYGTYKSEAPTPNPDPTPDPDPTPGEVKKLEVSEIRTMTASSVTETNEGENLTSITSDKLKELLFDDQATTFWRSALGAANSIKAGEPYLELKLNGIYDLTKIEYTARQASGKYSGVTGNIKNLIVQTSADGVNWTTMNGTGTAINLATATFPVAVEFNAQDVVFVRISAKEADHWDNNLLNATICVADLELYGTRVGDAPVDRSDLLNAINKAKALNQVIYEEAGWTAMQNALTAAKAVAENASQTEVDEAANALKAAIDALVEIKPMQNAKNYLNVPTYTASGKKDGEAVHPDIVDMSEYPDVCDEDGKWNGYRYYMATTPNQNGNSQFENPCLVASNDGSTWETPAGITNPLTNVPEEPQPFHNCDADMVYNDQTNELYLYYVWAKDSPGYGQAGFQPMEVRLFKIAFDEENKQFYSVNGTEPQTVITTTYRYDLLSPSIVKTGENEWKMWSVCTYDTGWNNQSNKVEYRVSRDGITWSDPVSLEQSFKQPGYYHWHVDVNMVDTNDDGVDDEYWAIYPAYPYGGGSNYTELFYAKSTDGLVWTTYENQVLIPDASSWDCNFIYRSTFLWDKETDMFRLWYSAGANGTDGWRIAYTENTYTSMVALLGQTTTPDVEAPAEPEYPSIKSALNAAIQKAQALTETDYTADTWAVLENKLEAALEVRDSKNATLDEVNAAIEALEAAMTGLKRPTPTGTAWYDVPYDGEDILFEGAWGSDALGKNTSEAGASATLVFYGTGIKWVGQKDTNFGEAKVYLDGELVETVDTYGSATTGVEHYVKENLTKGVHTLKIEAVGGTEKDGVIDVNKFIVQYDKTWDIKVSDVEAVASVQKMTIGKTATVKAYLQPFNASNKEVTFESKTPEIASVTAAGLVTALAVGEAEIVVKADGAETSVTINVNDGSLPAKRMEISNEKPLLIVPVYCQDAENDEYQWNDTLLGRWNSIPDDIKPYVVMEIHSSNAAHGTLKGFYERQLAIAEENQIPCMIVTVTAGQYYGYTATTDLDDAWLEEMIQKHEYLKGFVCTENYWIYSNTVANDVADHLKIAAENGGWMIWYEHQEHIIENAMSNSNFVSALNEYGSNFAMTWKNTPARANSNAETSAYMQGLWLAGAIDQWGGLMDTWKWYEKGFGKLFQGNISYANNSNGADEECRAVIMEPEAVLGIEMLSIYANGGTVYSFEHPAYTQGIDNENSPAFDNVIYETFKYVIDNPAPSKEKVLEDTKVVLHGNLSGASKIHTGITSNDQTLPTHSTGRYGLLPAVPSSVSTAAIPSDKVVSLSTLSAMSEEQQLAYLNEKYTDGAYEGNAFAQKVNGTWILYNSNVNTDSNQDATVSVDGQNVNVAMTPHTFTIVEKEANGDISVYLNNYRVNKDEVWDGYTSSTQKWDPDVNNLLQEWLRNNYMTNTKDGEDTFRQTVYTLTGLEAAPTVTLDRVMSDSAKTPVVAYEDGTATITIENNGYMEFRISLNSADSGNDNEGQVVNKLELTETIEKAEEATKEPEDGSIVFDEESKEAYEEALKEAKRVHEDSDAKQEDIDAANKALKKAIAGLASAVVVPDDDEAVAEEADEFIADILVAADYEGEPTVHQYMIEATENFVVSAEKPATMKIPVAGIEEGDIVIVLHKDSVKQEWVNMADAIVEVNYEEDYVLCKFENFSPVFAYVAKPADTTNAKAELEILIDEAEALKEENYTPETWEAFEKALEEAKVVLADDSAKVSEVEAATDALKDAIENLKTPTGGGNEDDDKDDNKEDNKGDDKKPANNSGSSSSKGTADKKALKKAIKKAEKLNEADYTWYSWDEIEDALEKAKEVYDDKGATQGEVDKAVALLNAAFNSLQYASKLVEVSAPAGTTPVKTGDSASIGLMVALLGIAAVAFVIVNYKKKRS